MEAFSTVKLLHTEYIRDILFNKKLNVTSIKAKESLLPSNLSGMKSVIYTLMNSYVYEIK